MSKVDKIIQSFPHETVLKIARAIRAADEEAKAASSLRVGELLQKHLDEDVDVLSRHEPIAYESGQPGYYCFWCSEDGFEPIIITWPCPEVRSVAKALGVEL